MIPTIFEEPAPKVVVRSVLHCTSCKYELVKDRVECNACAQAWLLTDFSCHPYWEPKAKETLDELAGRRHGAVRRDEPRAGGRSYGLPAQRKLRALLAGRARSLRKAEDSADTAVHERSESVRPGGVADHRVGVLLVVAAVMFAYWLLYTTLR